ncbi:MAG: hypothetical protein ACRELF_02800 [Gemmataceae bacterium]
MRRLLILTVLVGLLLTVGCGPGDKVVQPTNVPPPPKRPPVGNKGAGNNNNQKPVMAPGFKP